MLGQFLLAEGPLTRQYIRKQLAVGGKAESYIGQLLAETQAPSESDLFELLAAGYTVPEIDLKKCKVQIPVAHSIPREIAVKYRAIPIDRIGDILCVVFAQQPNPKALEAIRRATGLAIKAFRCPSHHIQILLRRLYATEAAAAGPAGREMSSPKTAAGSVAVLGKDNLPTAGAATAAIPISEHEYGQIASGAVSRAAARWDSLHTSRGPLRAVRIARR
jgi:type IV pilus assembly protein PilB